MAPDSRNSWCRVLPGIFKIDFPVCQSRAVGGRTFIQRCFAPPLENLSSPVTQGLRPGLKVLTASRPSVSLGALGLGSACCIRSRLPPRSPALSKGRKGPVTRRWWSAQVSAARGTWGTWRVSVPKKTRPRALTSPKSEGRQHSALDLPDPYKRKMRCVVASS